MEDAARNVDIPLDDFAFANGHIRHRVVGVGPIYLCGCDAQALVEAEQLKEACARVLNRVSVIHIVG